MFQFKGITVCSNSNYFCELYYVTKKFCKLINGNVLKRKMEHFEMVLFREVTVLLQNMPSNTKLVPPSQGREMSSSPSKRNSKFRYLLSTPGTLEKRTLKSQAVIDTSQISLELNVTDFVTL